MLQSVRSQRTGLDLVRRIWGETLKTVLFICVHNSGRSQMAEAFFNQMAHGKARAISAGSQPADKVNPMAAEAMLEEGIDIRWKTPKLLTPQMMQGIARAITMGCENNCPVTTVETEDWGLPDPKGKSLEQVRNIRDQIKVRVMKLIEQIAPN
jgi:arsenate reductase